MHKSTVSQNHKTKNTQFHNNTGVCRLHIQIRHDLANQLMKTVFELKRNPHVKNRDATQRAVIEAALESFFHEKNNP